VVTDKHLLVIEEHAVDSLDRSLRRLGSLIVDVAVSTRFASLIGGDFARKDVAKGRKGIM
jgi:hypothetical protein